MTSHRLLSRLVFGFFIALGFPTTESKAGDLKFETQLIWGTDKEKPDDPKLKKVDPELAKRLQNIFKWTWYYQVTNVSFSMPEKGTKRTKLSDKCDVEVCDLGKRTVEVKLFGQGKLVKRVKQASTQCLVMAGDDRNDTAWFVVLAPK